MSIQTLLGFAILAGGAITFVYSENLMLAYVPGNYELTSDPGAEDFNEFLKAMEFSDTYRENIRKIKMRIEVTSPSDGEFTYSFINSYKNYTISFTLEKEFDQVLVDGRKCKSLFTLFGKIPNMLIHTQKFDGFSAIAHMQFFKEGATIVRTAKVATVNRIYKRV